MQACPYLHTGMKNTNTFLRLAVLLLSFGLMAAGCGIFETRTPEEPGAGSGSGFQQPDRAEVVIRNLQSAIAGLNTLNYMRSLSEDGFSFTPSASAFDNDPQIWQNWSRQSEENYFNNMRGSAQNQSGHALVLSDEERTPLPTGGERYTATYSLTIFHNRTGQGIPTVASGTFIMDLVQGDDGLWSVQNWTDSAGGSQFTWSDFKVTFSRD